MTGSLVLALLLMQRPMVGPVLVTTPATAPATTALTVQAAAAQTVNLQSWKTSAGAVVAYVGPTGIMSGVLAPTGAAAGRLTYIDDAGHIANVTDSIYSITNHRIGFFTDTPQADFHVNSNALFSEATALTAVTSTTDPFLHFIASYAGPNLSQLGSAALRNNAGTLQVSNNGAAWTSVSTGGLSGSGAANQLTYWTSATNLAALGAATNGQLPIGSTGATPVLAALTGTANQVIVTNGAGSITLSTPQNIHTSATPQFSALGLGGAAGAAGSLTATAGAAFGSDVVVTGADVHARLFRITTGCCLIGPPGDGTLFIRWGAGTPEASIAGNVGSLWLRTDGGASTTLYIKESGTGTTGWIAK